MTAYSLKQINKEVNAILTEEDMRNSKLPIGITYAYRHIKWIRYQLDTFSKLYVKLYQQINALEKRVKMAEKFIQKAIKHPGALRKTLKVKKGHKIPEAKLKKAEHSKNKTTAKRARLAETLKGLHK